MIGRLVSLGPPGRWLEQNRQFLLRLLVIAGVLMASTYLAPRVSERRLVLLLGGGMALVFLRWPPLGLVTLIVASLIVPFSIGTGTESGLNATILILGLLIGLWVLDMVRRRELRLFASPTALPLLGLSVVTGLAFLVGNLPWFVFAQPAPLRAQIGGLAVFLLSAGAFLLVGHQIRDLRWLQRLTWVFLCVGALYIAGRLVPGLDRFIRRLFQRGAEGSLFWTWLVALTFSQAAFNRGLHPGWRLMLAALLVATLYLGLFPSRAWAAGWLPALVGAMVILWVGAPRLGLLASLVGGSVTLLYLEKAIGLVMIGDQEYSLVTRWEAWKIVAEIIKVNPLLGLGPANYYHYTPLYPILGYHVSFNSHQQYVDIVAQTGVLGLACFAWFVCAVGRLGWKLRDRVPKGFAQAYVYGSLGGLAGTVAAGMLADWVLPFVYNIGLDGFRASVLGWLFLGGLVSLEQIVQRRHTDDS
jgi:O-antigen ligase